VATQNLSMSYYNYCEHSTQKKIKENEYNLLLLKKKVTIPKLAWSFDAGYERMVDTTEII